MGKNPVIALTSCHRCGTASKAFHTQTASGNRVLNAVAKPASPADGAAKVYGRTRAAGYRPASARPATVASPPPKLCRVTYIVGEATPAVKVRQRVRKR